MPVGLQLLPTGAPLAWRGDDLAFATAGLVALACAAWLALTTLACAVALARGNHRQALRIAGLAPPFARRVLQAALVSMITLTPATAHAAPPPAPLTLHVGADGRLTTEPSPRANDPQPAPEVPVVRTPPTPTTTTPPSTTAPTAVPATTATTGPTAAPTAPIPAPPRRSAPPTTVAAPARSAGERAHVVRAGDNLWRIAATELARAQGRPPAESDIARYWQRVMAANRATLRSGDPSLIFPGEVVTLPLD